MSSLEKALHILSCFSAQRSVLGVSEVAQDLGMAKSSVSRIMRTMADSGLLEQEDGRRGYSPGVMAFQLGNLYQKHLTVLQLVDDAVAALVERLGLTAYVGVLNGTDVVLISVRQGSYPIRLVLEKGTRVPAHVTAIGLALLARKSDAEIRRLYPGPMRYAETDRTITPDEIVEQAACVRVRGFAAVEGVTFRGFNALGVAVESVTERQCIGFSLSYPQEFLGRCDLDQIASALVATAQQIGVRTADPFWRGRVTEPDPCLRDKGSGAVAVSNGVKAL